MTLVINLFPETFLHLRAYIFNTTLVLQIIIQFIEGCHLILFPTHREAKLKNIISYICIQGITNIKNNSVRSEKLTNKYKCQLKKKKPSSVHIELITFSYKRTTLYSETRQLRQATQA